MCGITGYISSRKDSDLHAALVAMTDKIIKRGPDDFGYFQDELAGLGMRRLSIIGVDNGKQPIENEDGSLVLVYNGEMYNYQEIKEELLAKGHIFTTDTDSEVVLHGYEEYGTDIVNRMRGMFGFAIWNKKDKSMFIGRDVFGIKPMFYAPSEGQLVFGSEIKSILEFPGIEKRFNEAVLPNYLSFQYNVMEETFFKGIFQLMPAHYMIWKDGKVRTHRYWKPQYHFDENMTMEQAEQKLEAVMLDSVEKHQIADVEVASFLSGGVDSAFIAAATKVPKTFSVGFEWDDCNEIGFAEDLCKYLGIENTSKVITTKEYWDALRDVLYYLDEPVADPSIIPLYYLCQMAAQQVKVVMSGEGSDELFGGYNIYQTPLSLKPMMKIPRPVRRAVRVLMEALPLDFKGKHYLIRAGQDIEERFIGNAYVFQPKEVKKVLKNTVGYKKPTAYTAPFYRDVRDKDDITKMQYIDLNFWLRGDILHKSDRMSMAHSLEVRVPYLDREVAEVAFSIPTRLRVTEKATKYAFRRMTRKYLPQESAKRKKLGFPVPIRKWLRQDEYAARLVKLFGTPAARKYFQTAELQRLLKEHRSGKKDNARKLWTVYMFLLWYDINFGCANV